MKIATKAKKVRPAPMKSYFDYVREFPLRSIRSESDLDAAQAIIDRLLQTDLDQGGEDYLDSLADLVMVYEQEHHPIGDPEPHEMLQHLLESNSMSQAELVQKSGVAKSTISDLASGKRKFTVDHMKRIAGVFNLSASIFLPD